MTTIYTEDGTTITRRYRSLPDHWQDDGSGYRGEWVPATTALGYFPLIETERPADTDTTTHDYNVVRDGDTFVETWTERPLTEEELADRIEAESYVDPAEQVAVLAELLVADSVRAETMTDEEIVKVSPLFPPWTAKLGFIEAGTVLRHDGTLIEAIQSHTAMAHQPPLSEGMGAIWKIHRTPEQVLTAWQEGLSYVVDDEVTFNGRRYKCIQPHTAFVGTGWNPVVYAAGWTDLGPV